MLLDVHGTLFQSYELPIKYARARARGRVSEACRTDPCFWSSSQSNRSLQVADQLRSGILLE